MNTENGDDKVHRSLLTSVWRKPSGRLLSSKETSTADNLSRPVPLDRIHSTNFLCKNENGSSAIIVLPAAEANRLSRNDTIRTASCSSIATISSSEIPAIQTVVSFDEEMISINKQESSTWSLTKLLERFTTGIC